MKSFYIAAWFLLIIAAFFIVLTGSLGSTAVVVFGLGGLGLIYAPAVWVVLTGIREMKTE